MGSQRTCEVVHKDDEIHAYFVHADHIGSSNVLTNESGQRASLFEYKPFGSLAYAAEDNSYDTDKRFTGKTYDNSSGLHYYGARYYDSELGRFITADPTIQHPYDPQDFNRYAYCRNNPVKYVDPTGLGFWDWVKSFFAAFVGAVVGVVTSFYLGPIVGGMAGGAVAGAISGAFDGGLEGAIKGALIGGAIGGIMGGIGWGLESLAEGAGYIFAGIAMAAGGTYAGITGGGEGLANYTAGVIGGVSGASFGNTLVGQPTAKSSKNENHFSKDIQLREPLGKSQFEIVDDYFVSKGFPSAAASLKGAEYISQSAQTGHLGSGFGYIGNADSGSNNAEAAKSLVIDPKPTPPQKGTREYYESEKYSKARYIIEKWGEILRDQRETIPEPPDGSSIPTGWGDLIYGIGLQRGWF